MTSRSHYRAIPPAVKVPDSDCLLNFRIYVCWYIDNDNIFVTS